MAKFTKTLPTGEVVTLKSIRVCNLTLDFKRGLLQQGYKLTEPTAAEVEDGIVVIGTDFVTHDSVYFHRIDLNYQGTNWPVFVVYGVSGPFSGLFFMTRTLAECYFENITADKEPDDHDSGGRLFGELIQFLDK